MSARTQALLLSLALLVGLGSWYAARPGEFAIFSPGPTVNLLGESHGEPVVSIKGRQSYRDDGKLLLVTIQTTRAEDRVGLWRAIQGWIDPHVDVYPYSGVYQPSDTNQSTRQQSAEQMTSSKDAATAAALTELGIGFRDHVQVKGVTKGGPSDGLVEVDDRVARVNGTAVNGPDSVVEAVRKLKPGTMVTLGLVRDGKPVSVKVATVAVGKTGAEAKQSRVGITIGGKFDFPFQVKVSLDEAIGGPSAGLMFALTIVDLLTPGSMTDGKAIAGTGEISIDGQVGSIGGVRQKIAGAQEDGAHLFLVPADNCAEAVHADYDHDQIRLVRVSTLKQAIAAVTTWAKNPEAALPTCQSSPSRTS